MTDRLSAGLRPEQGGRGAYRLYRQCHCGGVSLGMTLEAFQARFRQLTPQILGKWTSQ